jgi:glutamate-1-semialdehyde 2,1-aminomutase
VAYGKAIGGGYPLGVVGGRSDILEIVGESRLNRSPPYVWMASTLGGNPISAAAANATLDRLERPGTYDQLHATGQYLRERIAAALRRTAVPGHVLGDGPLAQVLISDCPLAPRSSRDVRRSRSAANRWVMLDLFRRGVFLNPMGTKLYVSLAHDRATCDAFEDHLEQSLMALGERERAELHSNC